MNARLGVAIPMVIGLVPGSVCAEEAGILVCPLMHAKKMPGTFRVAAMPFTGPGGDGRRGSAGFVVGTQSLLNGKGTRWSFSFQRDPSGYGFQVIHPLGKGHVLVSVSSYVTIHRGGSWGTIGWGNPNSSIKVRMLVKSPPPLKPGVKHRIVSELSAEGRYRLWINDKAICEHKIESAKPLVLEVPANARIWGGSGRGRAMFTGRGFNGRLRSGNGGVILSPMDGSGPRHNVTDVRLSAVSPPAPPVRPVRPPFRDKPKPPARGE